MAINKDIIDLSTRVAHILSKAAAYRIIQHDPRATDKILRDQAKELAALTKELGEKVGEVNKQFHREWADYCFRENAREGFQNGNKA